MPCGLLALPHLELQSQFQLPPKEAASIGKQNLSIAHYARDDKDLKKPTKMTDFRSSPITVIVSTITNCFICTNVQAIAAKEPLLIDDNFKGKHICNSASVAAREVLTSEKAIETTRFLKKWSDDNPVDLSPSGKRYAVAMLTGDVEREGNWLTLITGKTASLPRQCGQYI